MLVMCEKESPLCGWHIYEMLVSHIIDCMSLCRLECLLPIVLVFKG
jgi:hypothetical protein